MAPELAAHVINIDNYLETESGRVFTAERNRDAWARAYAELETALAAAEPGTKFYVVFGVQGAGKSSWIAQNLDAIRPADKRVPEDAVRSVFGMLEPPSWDEGFESPITVTSRDER